MSGIFLSTAELDVLSRCSGVAVKAYLRIRARMDVRTGLAGVKSGLSYQALREWTEEAIERGAGEQTVQPSVQEIRTALAQLQRRGLLRRAKTEKLVFKCILAVFVEERQKRTQQEPNRAKTPEPSTVRSTEHNTAHAACNAIHGAGFGCGLRDELDTVRNTEPNKNPTGQNRPNSTHIGDRSKPSTPQAASTAESGVGLEAAIAALGSAKRMPQAPEPETVRRATAIAVWLRGEQVQCHAQQPQLLAWVAQGITDDQLRAAVVAARQGRAEEGSMQPLNLGYINAKLQSVLRPPRSREPAWWVSVNAMEAKARELGISGARPGEEMDGFRARISDALLRAQEAVA